MLRGRAVVKMLDLHACGFDVPTLSICCQLLDALPAVGQKLALRTNPQKALETQPEGRVGTTLRLY